MKAVAAEPAGPVKAPCSRAVANAEATNPLVADVGKVFAADETPTQKLLRENSECLNQYAGENIPDREMDRLWNQIEKQWMQSNLPLRLDDGKNDRSGLILGRLKKLFEDIKKRGGFRNLTSETMDDFMLDAVLCRDRECSTLDGFYLPDNHRIYLSLTSNSEDDARTLLHELFHAYQFAYRLPLDLTELSKLAKEGEIQPSKISRYLDSYYESQAHWKGMQYSLPNEWVTTAFARDRKLQQGLALVGTSALGAWSVAGSAAGVGLLIYGGAYVANLAYGNASTNAVVPKVAQVDLLHFDGFGSSRRSPLALPELVPEGGAPNYLTFNSYDFSFHREFAKAVNREYFGAESSDVERGDTKVHNHLHDNYYDRIGLVDTVESDPRCRALLDKILSSSLSPMAAWLTADPKDIEACPAYAGASNAEPRKDFVERTLKPLKSMEHGGACIPLLLRDGGEGGRPGLRILPQLHIHPGKE